MTRYRTELGQVIYNPRTGAHEGRVRFHEDGRTVSVPCALAFPVETEDRVVASALVRQAEEIRRNARVPLVSRLRPGPAVGPHGPTRPSETGRLRA